MATKVVTEAVLVLAGLADPCGDVGTECRYDLLPIPWARDVFRSSVVRMLKAEKWTIQTEDLDANTHSIGVRCWVCRPPESYPLCVLVSDGWSDMQGEMAAVLIDGFSRGVPAVEFVWPNSDPDNEEAIAALEKLLSQMAK